MVLLIMRIDSTIQIMYDNDVINLFIKTTDLLIILLNCCFLLCFLGSNRPNILCVDGSTNKMQALEWNGIIIECAKSCMIAQTQLAGTKQGKK